MNSFELDAYLAREREAVEEARHRVTDRFVSTLPSSLSEPITYAFESGGKRIRPIILVAAYQAILDMMGMADERAEDDAIYELAVAFEFIHTYSLIHDDLPSMDEDRKSTRLNSSHVAISYAVVYLKKKNKVI